VKQSTHNAPSAGSSPALPTSGSADWMLNAYSKYVEPTQEDIEWYFKQKELTTNNNRINYKL